MEELVRIVVLDFYMSSPIPGLDVTYSDFRGASVNQVPILRCFGSTKSGEKICVHIHGVFPYLYIPYDGVGNSEALMYQISANIDKAVNTSLNQGRSSTQHVYKISLVSGIPMYGYHPKKHQFFKIYLYNPMLVSTVTNLLVNHSILDRVFQPHEAHINFTLQFMIDYNLHGMSNMVVSDLKFRVNPEHLNSNINKDLFLPASVEKITTCWLECDINAENILNRQEIISGNLAVNPGIAALWADERQRRRNKNEDSQLGQFLDLKNMKFIPTKTHLIFQQALAERLAILSTDKDTLKKNFNLSVYPAETPNNVNIQNASLIDIHTSSSLEVSLDDTINISSSLDNTITSTQGNLSITMDEDAKVFLQLLEKLANENALEKSKEDDCILSQVLKEDEPNDDSNEDFLDLSMPLAANTTPRKVDQQGDSDKSDDDDNGHYFDTTLIPQVDGQAGEISDSLNERIIVRKTGSSRQDIRNGSRKSELLVGKATNAKLPDKINRGRSMPLLETYILSSDVATNLRKPLNKINMFPVVKLHRIEPIVKLERHVMTDMFEIFKNHPRTSQSTKRTQEERIEEHLRLIRFRIDKMNARSKLKRIGMVVGRKEMVMGASLRKLLKPKFNIVPGRKWFLESRPKGVTNHPIIYRIVKQTHNYTDPTLHLLVKQSNNQNFFYYYGGKAIPVVTEIPPDLSESDREKLISHMQKSNCYIMEKRDVIKRWKIKLLHNKILNNKPRNRTRRENKFKIPVDIKGEASCKVKFADLLHDLKVMVSKIPKAVEHELLEKYNVSGKTESTTQFETDLREEIEQTNITLQRHIQHLTDFNLYQTKAFIPVQVPTVEEKFGIFNNLNNNLITELNEGRIVVSYEVEGLSELPTSEEVAEVLGEIRSIKKARDSAQGDFSGATCHLKISISSSDKENVSDEGDITLTRSSESEKHDETRESCSQGFNLKVLADISNNFEGPPYHKKNSTFQVCHTELRRANNIDNSPDTSYYTNYDNFMGDDNNPEFKRNLNISSDSDYMSLSSNSLGRNTPCGFDYDRSPPKAQCIRRGISQDVHVKELNNFLKSSQAFPRINIISDVKLEKPLHVHCLRRSASSGLVGTDESSFGNGAEDADIVAHYQYESKVIWDHTYTQRYKPDIVKKRRRSTPNIYINCDGAVDSSSEDEDKLKPKSKKHAKRRTLSQYAPLQISVKKSPRVPGNAVESGLADSMVGISEDQANFHGTSSTIDHKCSLLKSCVSFKRKLFVENEVPLNQTTTEEFLSCAFSPKNISTPAISSISNNTTGKISDKLENPPIKIADTDFDQHSYHSQPSKKTTSQHLESDSDLFSEDERMNKSFFKSFHLTVSERYDKETKFKAKEGCSTVFTPNSIVSLNNTGSQALLNIVNADIPPYQETTSPIFSESSSSEIPPFQTLKQLGTVTLPTEMSSCVNSRILKSALSAPSRLQVETSLSELKFAESNVKEPFYSSVEDYSSVVEIGHNTLKIPSKSTCHLSDFESDFNNLIQYRQRFTENVANLIWNSSNLKNLKLSHCNNRYIVIRPIKRSPSVNVVQQWLKDNSKENKLPLTPDNIIKKNNIYIPCSPGNDQDDLELSLSVTPCTPITSQVTLAQSSDPGTPKSSQNSSPILDHRKKKSDPSFRLRDSLLSLEQINKSCQITGISHSDSFEFNKSVQNLQAVRVVLDHQNLTTMVMELHIRTRGDLKPDPEYDPLCAIFYSVLNDVPEPHLKNSKTKGVVALNCLPINVGIPNSHFLDGICIDCDTIYVETEEAIINKFLSIIKYWDPDIFAGYEIQMLSWGYLIDRAFILSINIIPLLGRSQINKYGKPKQTTNYELETAITGRIVLDVWRIMRHEIALQSYTFESIVYHILHRRVPKFSCRDLTFWWDHRTSLYRHRVVSYYSMRVDTVLELFDKLDFLNRTSELARLFGILFYEVLSRGSQFRVESMMLRLAKPLNYVPVSPNTAQRASMKAPEYIPLVMEPESKLYNDPVIVLDFQSLYPSIIIAYNYCFTTCVGRVSCLGTNAPYAFGATQLKIPRKVVEKLTKRNLLNFSPCGVAFVQQKVRQGILPRMLTEILDTRLMVKNSMKENKGNENLRKVLHNRQLGLKLIANVTYGYTAANFSGRMCCVEIGDSVVSKARETLQRAIALVESTTEWGARVVYGDTDSLFVMVPGKSKETAFEVGKRIADAITADNPDPIKLKLEKVYQPCILQTKKRYVGYMYESPDQKEPVYDAKGIETVRRDGCPAVSKMLQKCLTLLFETKDVSLIRKYILRQFNKIQAGRASIQDLTFAKEYRGASGYKPGACVPALELARKWTATDRRSEPRSGERVPYIIVNGPPGLPLIRLVRSPRDLLKDSSLRPNSLYYITKVIIPPINRCLNLIGADLHTWFNQMPRKNTRYLPNSSPIVKSTISQYFVSKICASCSQPTQNGLCDRCCRNVNVTAFTLTEKLRKWEENYFNTKLICHSCTGDLNEIVCNSLDCPVIYRRTQTYNDLQQSTYVRELLVSSDIFSEKNVIDD